MLLFSHRGFLNKNCTQENTIKAFQNAINYGFQAIEVDIWYFNNELILSHDQPDKNLNHYDRLENLFNHFKNKIIYWLDFKNLQQDNVKNAIANLKKIIDQNKIQYQQIFFIPCLDNLNLKQNLFSYEEIRKNFTQNCNLGAFISNIEKSKLLNYRQQLQNNEISNLSVQYKNIDEKFIEIFHDINLFAWTVNKEEDLINLKKLGVKNIATDKLIPPKCPTKKQNLTILDIEKE